MRSKPISIRSRITITTRNQTSSGSIQSLVVSSQATLCRPLEKDLPSELPEESSRAIPFKTFAWKFSPISIAYADLNGDGFEDIITGSVNFFADFGFRGVTVLVNQAGANILIGDVNLDGAVDLLDVQPFIDVLLSGEYQTEADINCNGLVELTDVAPFVELLMD